jgi:two-component system sensor histidine kinase/response regulator
VASGLKHVGGQISTLTRALNRFVSTYRHGAPELVHPGAIDNAQQWKDICHSLRGACGTIGATRLRQELMDFEQSLVAAPTDPSLATRAEQIHGELLALVQQLDAVLTR